MSLLSVERVRVNYGAIPALSDISLTVNDGEIVGLIGPNGAGKTTLLKTIGGLLRCASGSIVFAGTALHKLAGDAVARTGISLVPEGRGIFPALSVEDNLRMGGYWAGTDYGDRLQMVTDYFPILAQRHRQAAASLSGGEQQQLAIGRALMAKPRLLMLDELSLGLAPRVVTDLFAVLRRINAAGTAVLLVEQQVPQALALSDRVYVMERGRITMSGTSTAVAADAGRVMAAYLGENRRAVPAAVAAEARGTGDTVEIERLPVALSHRLRRQLQTRADEAGLSVGELIGSLLARQTEAGFAATLGDQEPSLSYRLSSVHSEEGG
ncbi:MAG TPA: ABC transporter ATP-binding protein [Candidatus Dormibacteraeota bacterium]|jgi:branched-chain amino acid transport system ATP-binding protein|nr:ABC transporter ATP-binding protein [Candidatus Dormibacteraeota bacterium]